jgi:UDP-glucuronate 4-epimerase
VASDLALVTGGAGFIGSHLVRNLLASGHGVTVLDDFNDYYDPALKRENAAAAAGATFIEGDIRDERALARAFEAGPDAVVHLAARAGVRPSLEQPDLYASVNISGTFALLEACRRAGVRKFVFASSSSVYGDAEQVPFREDLADPRPVSPYGVTKQAGEQAVRLYHRLHGFRTSALRFFTVYGPGQRPDMAIHKFARLILDGKDVPIFGDGTTRRDYTYVDDAVGGILGALKRDDGFEVYNIGESRTVELSELVALIEKNLGKKARVQRLPEQPGDVKRTYADISKAKANLGYAPSTPIEAGMAKFCEWLVGKR